MYGTYDVIHLDIRMVITQAETAKSGSEDFELLQQSAFVGIAGRGAQAKKTSGVRAGTLTTTAGLEEGRERRKKEGREGGREGGKEEGKG